jgi:hypothetical protein
MEPWRLTKKPRGSQWSNLESWMFCRPAVEDSQHLDEELDPHQSEKSDPDRFSVKSWIKYSTEPQISCLTTFKGTVA